MSWCAWGLRFASRTALRSVGVLTGLGRRGRGMLGRICWIAAVVAEAVAGRLSGRMSGR
jgi:hypothetical protein